MRDNLETHLTALATHDLPRHCVTHTQVDGLFIYHNHEPTYFANPVGRASSSKYQLNTIIERM